MNTEYMNLIEPGRVYGLVLGRGGSKGLPRKNVRHLGGQPLIAWAVAAGRAANSVHRILCSTDDEEIAAAAQKAGAEIPFIRPAEYSTDSATDMDVFKHTVHWLANNEKKLPEFFVQLRPTTPFRDPCWIDNAIANMVKNPTIDSARSITPSPISPYKMWRKTDGGTISAAFQLEGLDEAYNMPRQKLPTVYWHTGQLDIIRTKTILNGSMTGKNIAQIDVPPPSAIDIDTEVDFLLAELLFNKAMPKPLIDLLERVSI